ncbi:hypothetical protein [Nannocystis pusilla]|uniref:hypothetical protein n=1 Tax=Nannocystis pusilla TaxID=889268 RepID=UPI003B7921F8
MHVWIRHARTTATIRPPRITAGRIHRYSTAPTAELPTIASACPGSAALPATSQPASAPNAPAPATLPRAVGWNASQIATCAATNSAVADAPYSTANSGTNQPTIARFL